MKAKDYRSPLEPVWCNGCGDFGVLKGLTSALADLEIAPEKLGIISGIGCSSRLPGYTRSYAFNSIHGRALPIASGLKLSRPEITTVVVGGDGDGFSIGLGHIPHTIRRNVDLTYAVLDNGIYGLTKGQASPTSTEEFKRERGLAGVEERPLNPVLLVLSSGAGFVARTHAGNLPHLREMFREAIAYKGFAFLHILAGCVTYQGPTYGETIYQRCDILPASYDPTDLTRAMEVVRQERFALGVIYRREPDKNAGMGSHDLAAAAGIWPALGSPEAAREMPAE
ncbi:MAG TPA: thiamine pyrophosphate-dependent enzyme [Candidatus Eisenbacteria bacterium]|nr:thiamine pyrophosphate-dependent enzyme [Candidatus Eisenbacteria bacterium]